jgi:superfamily II DNA or RNA helicase
MSATRAALRDDLVATLSIRPGQTARELVAQLRRSHRWRSISKSDVNAVLYRQRTVFRQDGGTPPHWHVIQDVASPQSTRLAASPTLLISLRPHPWQRRALSAWAERDGRGVVEAVTGTGKTYVGLGAAALAHEVLGFKTAVVVPTRDLQDQWARLFSAKLPTLKIGRMGNGYFDDLRSCEVLIAIAQSAAQKYMLAEGNEGLLVADECHRYGAQGWSRVLEDRFSLRLGLTATYSALPER